MIRFALDGGQMWPACHQLMFSDIRLMSFQTYNNIYIYFLCESSHVGVRGAK